MTLLVEHLYKVRDKEEGRRKKARRSGVSTAGFINIVQFLCYMTGSQHFIVTQYIHITQVRPGMGCPSYVREGFIKNINKFCGKFCENY